jgi:hypothetical protein
MHLMKVLFLNLFGFILVTGCTVGVTRVMDTTEPAHPHVVPTKETTDIPSFTFINQPTEPPTLQASPDSKGMPTCPTVSGDPVELNQVTKVGTVLVKDWSGETRWSLLNLLTGKSIPLPSDGEESSRPTLGESIVSPDRNHLAYLELSTNTAGQTSKVILRVVDANGTLVTNQKFYPEQFFQEWRWLDRERLEIITPANRATGTILLFNTLTGQWQSLTNKFPNMYQDFELRPSQWSVSYSPDMTWAIYLGQFAPAGAGPVVWEITSDRVIWESISSFWGIHVPQWSPIGNVVAVIVNDTLYRINHEGQAEPVPLADTNQVVNFSWSPDGQHLAMLVRDQPEMDNGRLLVYTPASGETIDFCNTRKISYLNPAPIWSPDSRMLIDYLPISGDHILIDIQNRAEYQLKPINILVWMNSFP